MPELIFHGHSAVSVRTPGEHLFIDPGAFSDLAALSGATGVLITHEHPDHIAPGALAVTDAPVWAPAPVVAQLEQAGVAAARLHAVAPGESFTAAGLQVSVRGGDHAEIYCTLPGVRNNAYLVEGVLLHPGDSLPAIADPAGVQFVLLPVAAPWLKLSEAIDFAKTFPQARFAPIHDGILSDAGKGLVDMVLTRVLGAATYQRVAADSPTGIG